MTRRRGGALLWALLWAAHAPSVAAVMSRVQGVGLVGGVPGTGPTDAAGGAPSSNGDADMAAPWHA